MKLDRARYRGFGKARPAGARVELRSRGKEPCTTCGAAKEAVIVIVDVRAAEGRLSTRLAQNAKLLGTKTTAPLVVGKLDIAGRLNLGSGRLRIPGSEHARKYLTCLSRAFVIDTVYRTVHYRRKPAEDAIRRPNRRVIVHLDVNSGLDIGVPEIPGHRVQQLRVFL